MKVYGLGFGDAGGADGQTSWSWYAASNGWKYSEGEPWGTKFFYGDPKFTETIGWWRGLITKGFMPPLAQAKSGIDSQRHGGVRRGEVRDHAERVVDARYLRSAQAGEDEAGPVAAGTERQADVDDERPGRQHLGRYHP